MLGEGAKPVIDTKEFLFAVFTQTKTLIFSRRRYFFTAEGVSAPFKTGLVKA
jgi:hypothetical protein